MSPNLKQIYAFWELYDLPAYKRNHSALVATVAVWFAEKLKEKQLTPAVNTRLLIAAALLHDIDKSIPKKDGERHPDTGVRILREAGFPEVADLVRTHPLHAILDQTIAPESIEEKLLYLSDKMVKHAVITVDERFALWQSENLPPEAKAELALAYPKVKALEHEICTLIGVDPQSVAHIIVKPLDLSTMMSSQEVSL